MYYRLIVFIFLLSCFILPAQDAYHLYLNDFLGSAYDLPEGEWLLFDNESAIYNTAYNYGSDANVQNAADQVFSLKEQINIASVGNNPWDSGWGIRNQEPIAIGDKLLIVFYLRSVNGSGEVNFFVEDAEDFVKEIYLTFELTEEWTRLLVPIETMRAYAPDNAQLGFHLALQEQTIEIGGFTAINYKNTVALQDLPSEINNQFYGGYEEDAPWRGEAAQRIENLRKADLTIQVNNSLGDAIDNASINLKMLRHNFSFGTAVTAERLAGNNNHNAVYENKLIDLDGQGHGFNAVVFENDLKWPSWEDEWYVNKSELIAAVDWLREHGLTIRGHNLVWPGNTHLPDDVAANINDLDYVRTRVNNHLEDILTYEGLQGQIEEWDVLNEIVANTAMADAFANAPDYQTGREVYTEIFDRARAIDPNTGLWLNDYVTLSLNQTAGGSQYDNLKQYIQELNDAGVDIEGIGFQGHIGGAPNSIYDVLETLDDFYNTFGLRAKITEFDLPNYVSEELAANYLSDFMTAIFSHESMDGFLFWSFWDGATYMNPGANLFRMDWSTTPAHAAFTHLLFDEWWTEESISSNESGMAQIRGFKGLYELSYECEGVMIKDTISLLENLEYEIVCEEVTTGLDELLVDDNVKIFPSPSNGQLSIHRNSNALAHIQIYDAYGKLIYQVQTRNDRLSINLEMVKGIYWVEVETSEGILTKKIIFL
jgi:endo-1,4-beta-xylanase